MTSLARPELEMAERLWRGGFYDYRQHHGRWLPFGGEVGWILGAWLSACGAAASTPGRLPEAIARQFAPEQGSPAPPAHECHSERRHACRLVLMTSSER
jgi:hypothetical protein